MLKYKNEVCILKTDILDNLIIKKFYSASSVYTEKNVKMKRENRSCWAVVIKYEGETIYYTHKKSYVSNISNMVILPKGCSYKWHCTKPGFFSIIEFDSDMICDEIFSFPVKDGEKFLKMFKELELKRTLRKPMYELESIRDCYSIILKLTQTKENKYFPTYKHQKIAAAMDYIAKNYNKEITNDSLAEITGFSTVYFRKLFTEIYGVSPITYVHNLRIKKAKEMLKSDYGSITDIAKSLGYLNIYEFSKDFKNHTGLPPSKWSGK